MGQCVINLKKQVTKYFSAKKNVTHQISERVPESDNMKCHHPGRFKILGCRHRFSIYGCEANVWIETRKDGK